MKDEMMNLLSIIKLQYLKPLQGTTYYFVLGFFIGKCIFGDFSILDTISHSFMFYFIFVYGYVNDFKLAIAKIQAFTEDDIPELDEEQQAELDSRIKDLDDPTRYVISGIGGYYNIEDNCWCQLLESATYFKNNKYAELILEDMSSKSTSRIQFNKIITVKKEK
jgi:hypothetical protein